MDEKSYLILLKEQVKPALGCSEPGAVALCVAKAKCLLPGELADATVSISPNIFKNAMHVGIPGTDERGLLFSVALGAVCGDPDAGLEVFRKVSEEYVAQANQLIQKNRIHIAVEDELCNFFIEATLTDTQENVAVCVIENSHTNITQLTLNGKSEIHLTNEESDNDSMIQEVQRKFKLASISNIRKFAESVEFEKIRFLLDGAQMNMEMAEYGASRSFGASIGQGLMLLESEGILGNDIVNRVKRMTAAACDARMAGANKPVMSSAGSGNHGLTAIIPVAVVCKEIGGTEEQLARALAISHLSTAYIKEFTGRLSPICGCAVAAGIGASVAITWLYGGGDVQMSGAIQNMVGALAGMLCDGAKGGCALKLAIASAEAVLQANFAIRGVVIDSFDGIVGNDAEDTIGNLGKICKASIQGIDPEIIGVMLA